MEDSKPVIGVGQDYFVSHQSVADVTQDVDESQAGVFEQPFVESDVNPANLWWQEWQTLQQQHNQFLTQQTALHQQFLHWNAQMTQLLLSQDPIAFTETQSIQESAAQPSQSVQHSNEVPSSLSIGTHI